MIQHGNISWRLVGVLLFASLFPASPALATNRFVSTTGTNNPPFTNWAGAATNIQWAVDASSDNDTIWISNGVYVLTNQVTIAKSLALYGNPGELVVLDGNLANRCIYFYTAGKYVVLSNLFITRGLTNAAGGGVWMYNSIITDCIFSNNFSAGKGGGVYFVSDATCTVQRCSFIGNTASNGGGLYLDGNAQLVLIDRSTLYANVATNSGGGMYANDNYAIITNCDFISNLATNDGGGAYSSSARTNNFTHCTFFSNTAVNTTWANYTGNGGGICSRYGLEPAFIVSNCYMSNNFAGCAGGGIWLHGGQIRNSVIARNLAPQPYSGNGFGGGGIMINYYADAWTHLIQDCVIEENTGGYWAGGIYVMRPTVVRDCLIRNNVATGVGGGVVIYTGPESVLSGCTIVSNYTGSAGGGIGNTGNAGADIWRHSYENCIIYDNTCGNPAYSNYYTPADASRLTNCLTAPAFSGALAPYATNCITADPMFVNWTANDYHLNRDSPAVNSGVIRDWMANTFDLDGRRRIDFFSGQVDIGCYEYLPSGIKWDIK